MSLLAPKPLRFRGWYLCLLLMSSPVFAGLNSLYWINFGIGFPQLPSIELGIRALKKWQFGASYGVIPGGGPGGSISPQFKLPSQNVTLASGAHVTIYEPNVTVSFNSLCPYARFFPNDTGFYVQATVAMLRVHNTLDSDLYDVSGRPIADASYLATVDLTQFLPTLSIGHVFNSELFFFSLNMGLTVVANVTSNVSFGGNIPDSLGGSEANETALSEVNSKNQARLEEASKEFRNIVSFIPSLQLMFGMMF